MDIQMLYRILKHWYYSFRDNCIKNKNCRLWDTLGGGTQLTLSEPSAGREATVAKSLLAAVTLARPSEMVPLSISCAFST